jgi:Flp pilus assembly pilin Flp
MDLGNGRAIIALPPSGTIFIQGGMMVRLLSELVKRDEGQDLAEYGIALAVIAAFTVAVVVVISGDVDTLWSNANSTISDVANATPPN